MAVASGSSLCLCCYERETGRLWENWLITKTAFPSLDATATCPVRHGGVQLGHIAPGRGGRVETSLMKSLHVLCHGETMSRDFVVPNSISSMPKGLGSESPGGMRTGFCVG